MIIPRIDDRLKQVGELPQTNLRRFFYQFEQYKLAGGYVKNYSVEFSHKLFTQGTTQAPRDANVDVDLR